MIVPGCGGDNNSSGSDGDTDGDTDGDSDSDTDVDTDTDTDTDSSGPSGPAQVWFRPITGPDEDYVEGLAVDDLGNTYLAGSFQYNLDIDGVWLYSEGRYDMFIASWDADGTLRWAQRYGAPEPPEYGGVKPDVFFAVTVDPDRNVYVAGRYLEPPDFGGGTMPGAGTMDGFVASFDSDGTYRWAESMSAGYADWATSVIYDATAGLAYTGHQASMMSSQIIEIAHWDPATGEELFTFTILSSHFLSPRLALLPSGGLALAGNSPIQLLDLGGGELAVDGIVLAGYDIDGTHRWSAGANGATSMSAVATDASGNLVIIGTAAGEVDYQGTQVGPSDLSQLYDVLLLNVDESGVHRWSKTIGGVGDDQGYGVAVDDDGIIYVTGMVSGEVDFGAGLQGTQDEQPAFVASYSETGNLRWITTFGDTRVEGRCIAVGPDGAVYVAGRFADPVEFAGQSYVPAGLVGHDLFLLKLVP